MISFNRFLNIQIFILILVGGMNSAYSQVAKYVVVISIDGLRSEFYLDSDWGMRNVRSLMKDGVYALNVESVFPSLTLPAHTTIVTGVLPQKHKVFYNRPYRPNRESNEWYWYFEAIKSPTLWETVKEEKNGITASVNWPVTVGAPIDYNFPVVSIPGVDPIQAIQSSCTPGDLFMEIQENATGKLNSVDLFKQGNYLAQDQTMTNITAYLIKKYKPVLTTVRLACVDFFQHREGRDGDMVKIAVAGVDRNIRSIIEAVETAGISDSTTIIITGDHGHANKNLMIAPNIWLRDAGLIENVNTGDWLAQFKAGSGGSVFLYLKNPADQITRNRVIELLDSLPPSINEMFRIIEKEELVRLGVDEAVSLALSANLGFSFSDKLSGPAYLPTSGATHGHIPYETGLSTGFVAFGAGIRSGVILQSMSLTDIASIVSALLGTNFPFSDSLQYKGIVENY